MKIEVTEEMREALRSFCIYERHATSDPRERESWKQRAIRLARLVAEAVEKAETCAE